jgi:hypothetical protein
MEQNKNKVNCQRPPIDSDSALRGEIGALMRRPANLQNAIQKARSRFPGVGSEFLR